MSLDHASIARGMGATLGPKTAKGRGYAAMAGANATPRCRPILFSAPMVRALLAGRKTMTRRIIKPQPNHIDKAIGPVEDTGPACPLGTMLGRSYQQITCPFGRVGDRLWVKESVWCWGNERRGRNGQMLWPKYEDDAMALRWFDKSCEYVSDTPNWHHPGEGGALNKMFMPRWASRITLEITDIRAQRLTAIDPADAANEGWPEKCGRTPLEWFAGLWRYIHGPDSWASDPWVWALTFRVVKEGKVAS